MNIFYLSTDPKEAAEYHCDKHVVKMATEYVQMLSTTLRLSGFEHENMYKVSWINHPATKWVRESLDNFLWLKNLATFIGIEYTFRYKKKHLAISKLETFSDLIPNIPKIGITNIPLCMPVEYHSDDPVESYRTYYVCEKARFARWNNGRNAPSWFI